MFLTDNLWTIFEVAKEYREKGPGGATWGSPGHLPQRPQGQ